MDWFLFYFLYTEWLMYVLVAMRISSIERIHSLYLY